MKRDEEEARLAQKREERRQRGDEATDRLDLLRQGQDSPPGVSEPSTARKRSREDSTQDDLRLSKYQRRDQTNGEGVDHNSERSAQRSDDPLDNITNMRLRDAAGRGKEKPWYSSLDPDTKADTAGRDVWGNEDAGRQTRDLNRLITNDPLLAMKRGVKQLKESEKQKAEWRRERERDLNEVEELARQDKRRDRHPHNDRRTRRRSRDRVRRRSSPRRHRHRSKSPRRAD